MKPCYLCGGTGHGILSAVTDILRVSRLHVFLSRTVSLMRADVSPAAVRPSGAGTVPQYTLGHAPVQHVKREIAEGANGVIKSEGVGLLGGAMANGVCKGEPVQALTPPGDIPVPELVWEVPGSGAVQIVAVGPVRAFLLIVPLLPISPQEAAGGNPLGPGDTKPPPDEPILKGLLSGISAVPNGVAWDSIPRLPTMDFTSFLGALGSGLGTPLSSLGPTIESTGLLGPRLSSISNFLIFDSPSRSPERAAQPAALAAVPPEAVAAPAVAAAPLPPPPPRRPADVPSLRVCVEWVTPAPAPQAENTALSIEAVQRAASRAQHVQEVVNEETSFLGLEELAEPVSSKDLAQDPVSAHMASPGLKLTCRVRSVPGLPSDVLRSLEALAGALPPLG